MQGTYIDLLRGRLNFTIVDVVVDVVVVVVVVVKVVVDDVVGQGVGLHPRIVVVVDVVDVAAPRQGFEKFANNRASVRFKYFTAVQLAASQPQRKLSPARHCDTLYRKGSAP